MLEFLTGLIIRKTHQGDTKVSTIVTRLPRGKHVPIELIAKAANVTPEYAQRIINQHTGIQTDGTEIWTSDRPVRIDPSHLKRGQGIKIDSNPPGSRQSAPTRNTTLFDQ